VLVAALLGLLAGQTPLPWAALWIAVPVVTALATLAAWRFGAWGLVLPVLAAAAAVASGTQGVLWAWWLPAAALAGAWTGLREEGGGNSAGARAWRLAPVLMLAAALPSLAPYPELVKRVESEMIVGDRDLVGMAKQFGYGGERLATFQRAVDDNARTRRQVLPHLLPTGLFLWMVLLAAAGRLFAARLAATLRWPSLTRTRLVEWRLPDGALWTFLVGLGLVVSSWGPAAPGGWTLLLNAGLGFAVQGIAVVESLLLARGVPSAWIVLTMLFVFAVALPVSVVTATALGLSDAWLDYRRLEPARDGGEA
jgi:hypothetical protein